LEGGTEREEEEGRRSKDKKVNREGRYLIEALEEAGWWIFNGGRKGDEEGEWTYAGGRGESVLDYVIEDEEVWEKVDRIRVEDRIDSDHFPVVVWIKGDERIVRGSEGSRARHDGQRQRGEASRERNG